MIGYHRGWVEVLDLPVERAAREIVKESQRWDRLREYSPFAVNAEPNRAKLRELRRRTNPRRHVLTQAETKFQRVACVRSTLK